MNTRRKNKSTHPGIPDMSASQLLAIGLTPTPHRASGKGKKLTKDQQIASLTQQLHAARGGSLDASNADLSTDEEANIAVGSKRKAKRSATSTPMLKRSRAINPFESSSAVGPRATGLVDNWQTKIHSPHAITFQTPEHDDLSHLPMTPTPRVPISPLVSLSFEDDPIPTFTLPKMENGSRSNPGIKDLPPQLRDNFRNVYIRHVMKQVANSKLPWGNPEVGTLQEMYNIVYPGFPRRMRHSDAAHHPTITALGVLRNHIACAAVVAVQRHLTTVYREKRITAVEKRAEYIAGLFKSENDHPIIWRQYVSGVPEGNPHVKEYKTKRRGGFQSDPILETFLVYYSSSGIMEDPPLQDPGVGERPLGILALATAAVERAYKMHATGDFIASALHFKSESWGPSTARYLDHVVHDLHEHQWDSIFRSLDSFSVRTKKEEAIRYSAPEGPHERVTLPPSDPPSPPRDE